MVEVMKIMVTSFKRSHAYTATLSAPNPAASHHRLTPLLETPGHSQASLGQSLMGSLLLSLGSFFAQDFVVPSKSLFLKSFLSSEGSLLGLMVTSFRKAYATPMSSAARDPVPVAGH